MTERRTITALTGCLEIKLGACLTGPSKRLAADLHAAARSCDRSRNAMLRHWERWREDHADWEPQPRRNRAGEPKCKADGEPVLEHPALSQDLENALYHRGREVAPDLAAKIVSQCRAKVVDDLKTKMPYNHEGDAHFRWQGILAYEINRPCYRSPTIPVPNQDALICYQGAMTGKPSHKMIETMRVYAGSACALRFPLFSGSSGRQIKAPVVRLEVRQLSPGNRAVVARIASGQWKFCDSRLVFKRNRWFFQLSYQQPACDLQLDRGRTATLWPADELAERPFRIESEDGRDWKVGNGNTLVAQYQRLEMRRRALQERYRTATHRGRGKAKYFEKHRPYELATRDAQAVFCWRLIEEVVRFCKRNNCGRLLYREPTLGVGLRAHSWFAKRDVPFNWVGFASKLAWKCQIYGMELVVERLSRREHDGRSTPEESA